MRSVNKVILVGNLTRDPVLKSTENGQPVCTFGIATNREWRTRTGEKKSLPEFHNIVAWSKLADKCFKYLKKGKLVFVEGYLKTRVFDNDNGSKSFRTEIVIYDMIMLDRKGGLDTDYDDTFESDELSHMEEAMRFDSDNSPMGRGQLKSIETSIDNL
ncbi:single-stranded DNA-binding protein [Candidatus Gracilibacteria bacterium CG17_big_fil_post_rev_8_21_14_2_50_48_13]|nr:MAG: single-stranded DNA-binding protein [Candidatus Gracilibacteria bacterium CG17_big_fil_post_rev_8_21_14_2_50_48_13]